MNLAPNDIEGRDRINIVLDTLARLGWTVGTNIQVDQRWAVGEDEAYRKYAAELVGLAPDVLLASGGPSVTALQRVTRTIPIVFATVTDPVGAGFVESLSRPGGNTTGFTTFEFGISAKWLEALKQVAPNVRRVGVLRDPSTSGGLGLFGALQSVASSFRVELHPIDVREPANIEHALLSLQGPADGLVVTQNAKALIHRNLIIKLAERQLLPAMYGYRLFAADGGLMSYGPDTLDPFRKAAHYIDRILKGERPADLPVEAPTKYELVINLKTVRALGITLPPSLLSRADEVIE